jgi:amidase
VPMHAFASDFEAIFTFGPMARTIADARLMFGVMQGPDDRDPRSVVPGLDQNALARSIDPSELRVAVSVDLGYYEVDGAVAENTQRAGAVFRKLGATVTDVALGWDRSLNDAWALNWAVLLATLYGELETQHRAHVDPELSKLIEQGRRASAIDLKTVDVVATRHWARLRDVLAEHDVLLCPTVALPVPPAVGVEDSDFEGNTPTGKLRGFEMTSPFSLMPQCPVVSLPSGVTTDGLPTGVQLVGRRFADAELLAIAEVYELASPWPTVSL